MSLLYGTLATLALVRITRADEYVIHQFDDLPAGGEVSESEYSSVMRNLLSTPTKAPSHDPTKTPLNLPTPAPTNCLIYTNGLGSVDMGLYQTTDATDKPLINALSTSDPQIDGEEAENFCTTHFGSSSGTVWPASLDIYRDMIWLCQAKHDDEPCYFGLYRAIDDYVNDEGSCSIWTANTLIDGKNFLTSSTDYLEWGTDQPKCNWYNPNDDQKKRHCMFYKYNRDTSGNISNRKLVANQCDVNRHVICKYSSLHGCS